MEKQQVICKVPEVTLIFWIIKIVATTLGETGGDAVSMSMNLGYLISTGIFMVIFILAVGVQISAKNFHPVLYWATIVATTTVGTTLADFADRSLGIGYVGGTAILFTLLMASLFIWYRTLGSISIDTVSSPKSEIFYWVTIMFSQTLGTALGDWTSLHPLLHHLFAALSEFGLAGLGGQRPIGSWRYSGKSNQTTQIMAGFANWHPAIVYPSTLAGPAPGNQLHQS